MTHVHFLGRLNDASWPDHVGSLILLSFGRLSAAKIKDSLHQLRASPQVKAFDLNAQELRDLSERQVRPLGDEYETGTISELLEQLAGSADPVRVPDAILKDVLYLTDEYDDVQVSRLTISQHGSLEVCVNLPDMFDSRRCQVGGTIDLATMSEAFAN